MGLTPPTFWRCFCHSKREKQEAIFGTPQKNAKLPGSSDETLALQRAGGQGSLVVISPKMGRWSLGLGVIFVKKYEHFEYIIDHRSWEKDLFCL